MGVSTHAESVAVVEELAVFVVRGTFKLEGFHQLEKLSALSTQTKPRTKRQERISFKLK